MKTAKITTAMPNKIILPNGKVQIKKSLYTGRILEMTPEQRAECAKIEKEIANWQTEMYQMEKACAMFITSKNVKDRMTGRMNYISTEITRLRNELAQLKSNYRDAQ